MINDGKELMELINSCGLHFCSIGKNIVNGEIKGFFASGNIKYTDIAPTYFKSNTPENAVKMLIDAIIKANQ